MEHPLGQDTWIAAMSLDRLLRVSGQKVGRVTVTKLDIPGDYS